MATRNQELSKREKEVVEILLQGKSNKQIAEAMKLSRSVVRKWRKPDKFFTIHPASGGKVREVVEEIREPQVKRWLTEKWGMYKMFVCSNLEV